MYKDKELFDFSNYPKQPKYYDSLNNLVVGKMKDETCGVPVKGFIGLKSKVYTITEEENHECRKVKDINKPVVDDELKHEDYKNVLFTRSYVGHETNRIPWKGHTLGT